MTAQVAAADLQNMRNRAAVQQVWPIVSAACRTYEAHILSTWLLLMPQMPASEASLARVSPLSLLSASALLMCT